MGPEHRKLSAGIRCVVIFAAALGWGGMMTSLALGNESSEPTEANANARLEPVGPPLTAGHEFSPREGQRKQEQMDDPELPETKSPKRIPSEWFGGDPWWNWSRATGHWGGVRSDLEYAGVNLEASYIVEWGHVIDGGVAAANSNRHLRDINLTLDLDKLWGIPQATLFIDALSTNGDSISNDAGDFQGLSNIEIDPDIHTIAELWYEQWMMDGLLRVKIGKVEANREFDFVESASEFINKSAGFSPTIFPLPSYPDPAMSVNLFLYPTDHSSIGLGVYDGATTVDGLATGRRGPASFFSSNRSDDYFFIGEYGMSWDDLFERGPGRFAVGVWNHTGDHPRFDGGTKSGTEGYYALAEQQIWAPDEDSERGLWGFAQYGFADAQVSAANHHLAGGVFLRGTFADREQDTAGLYVSQAIMSSATGSGFTENETAVELYYRVEVTPFFSLKPDLQFIMNPGGVTGVDNGFNGRSGVDALVFTLRAELTF